METRTLGISLTVETTEAKDTWLEAELKDFVRKIEQKGYRQPEQDRADGYSPYSIIELEEEPAVEEFGPLNVDEVLEHVGDDRGLAILAAKAELATEAPRKTLLRKLLNVMADEAPEDLAEAIQAAL